VPPRKRNVEEIVATLRQMERLTEQGMSVSAAASELGITDQTYYRWRTRFGSLSADEAKRLRELDEERARLRRVIEEQAQDISMLQDLTQGEIPSAARRRLAVAYLVDHYGISERRACRIVGQHRSTQRYGLTGAGEDGFAEDWAAGDEDARDEDAGDEMTQSEPGPPSGSDEAWRGPAEGQERPRVGATTGEEAERRPVSGPISAPDLALAPVCRIPLLDDRLPVLLRVRTSLFHDLVWLARHSETARLAASGGVLDRLQHLAGAPCRRLVQLFGRHQEDRTD
jgi:putative transposase